MNRKQWRQGKTSVSLKKITKKKKVTRKKKTMVEMFADDSPISEHMPTSNSGCGGRSGGGGC